MIDLKLFGKASNLTLPRKKKDLYNRCVACGTLGPDRAHVKTRGSGGKDIGNVLFLCRHHHILQHLVGWKTFTEKFPHVLTELKKLGFEFELQFGVWKLIKNNESS